jgi:O-succinylhomoserine sulfhydrylase
MRWGGGVVCIDLEGDQAKCFKFINSLNLLTITANLGDTRTIVTHPATTTHSKLSPEERHKMGIGETTLRFSIGLEDVEDVIRDIEQALKNSAI